MSPVSCHSQPGLELGSSGPCGPSAALSWVEAAWGQSSLINSTPPLGLTAFSSLLPAFCSAQLPEGCKLHPTLALCPCGSSTRIPFGQAWLFSFAGPPLPSRLQVGGSCEVVGSVCLDQKLSRLHTGKAPRAMTVSCVSCRRCPRILSHLSGPRLLLQACPTFQREPGTQQDGRAPHSPSRCEHDPTPPRGRASSSPHKAPHRGLSLVSEHVQDAPLGTLAGGPW